MPPRRPIPPPGSPMPIPPIPIPPPRPIPRRDRPWLLARSISGCTDFAHGESLRICFVSSSLHSATGLSFQAGPSAANSAADRVMAYKIVVRPMFCLYWINARRAGRVAARGRLNHSLLQESADQDGGMHRFDTAELRHLVPAGGA